jgi:hypothetical protein
MVSLLYLLFLAAAACAGAQPTPTPPPLQSSTCFPEYLSIFRWINNGRTQEYSYDLRTLCNVDRFIAYPIPSNPQTFWYFFWSVGGNISRDTFSCNPPWTPTYFSGGSFIQTYDWNKPSPTPPPLWPANATDPETGKALSGPSYPCIIFAHTRPEFDLIDENNPATGGLRLSYLGLSEPASDAFNQCPYSDVYSGEQPRRLSINLLCDPFGSDSDVTYAPNPAFPSDPMSFFKEVSTCTYELTVRTKAACGVSGDPYAPSPSSAPPPSPTALPSATATPAPVAAAAAAAIDTPGKNFGYTVLGSVLTVAGYFSFLWLDHRGYLDAARARLPAALGGRAAGGYTSSAGSSSASFTKSAGAYGSA